MSAFACSWLIAVSAFAPDSFDTTPRSVDLDCIFELIQGGSIHQIIRGILSIGIERILLGSSEAVAEDQQDESIFVSQTLCHRIRGEESCPESDPVTASSAAFASFVSLHVLLSSFLSG